MKNEIAVIYSSRTGNTQKVAEHLAEALGASSCRSVRIRQVYRRMPISVSACGLTEAQRTLRRRSTLRRCADGAYSFMAPWAQSRTQSMRKSASRTSAHSSIHRMRSSARFSCRARLIRRLSKCSKACRRTMCTPIPRRVRRAMRQRQVIRMQRTLQR